MDKKNYKISYHYDELNRLAAVKLNGEMKKYYSYDQAGNLIGIFATAPEKVEKAAPVIDNRFATLKREYFKLNDLAQAGAISLEEFQDKVNELRFQDTAGAWWQMRTDGAWLKWDGANWTEACSGIKSALP